MSCGCRLQEPVSDKGRQRRDYLSEAFHSLNQPLTALHCVIELALLQPRSSEEYRLRLLESLGLVDRIFELTAGVRELVEAEGPGLTREFAVSELLREVTDKYGAIASSRVELKVLDEGVVTADFDRLSKALIRLLEQLCGDGISDIQICTRAARDPGEIEITIGGEERRERSGKAKPGVDEKLRRLRLSAAMLAIEAGGGRLDYAPNYAHVTLPVTRLIRRAECEAATARGD